MPEPVRGVAYPFWVEVEQRRLDAGMEKHELAKLAKLARSTIDNLKSTRRAPTVKTVHTLADVLHIDRQQAEKLAGLVEPLPRSADDDVRAAVLASRAYTPDQKEMLLTMIDTIERANGTAPTDTGKS
jgi:transcriptional regulator with XRE-family HTH domain